MRHPLHPAIVHFPVACWSLATLADFASLRFGEQAWQWSGGLLAVGCAMAVVALMAGMVEVARVPEGPAMTDAYWHMGAMLTAFTLYATRLFVRLDHMQPLEPNTLALILSATGFIALGIGGYFGGKLVYGHGIGRE